MNQHLIYHIKYQTPKDSFTTLNQFMLHKSHRRAPSSSVAITPLGSVVNSLERTLATISTELLAEHFPRVVRGYEKEINALLATGSTLKNNTKKF